MLAPWKASRSVLITMKNEATVADGLVRVLEFDLV
jgi:hypothetical protein